MRTKMRYALLAIVIISLLVVGCTTTDTQTTNDTTTETNESTNVVDEVDENLDTEDVDAAIADINLDDW